MPARKGQLVLGMLLAVCAFTAACSSAPPKPDKVKITIDARPDINPDADGRPSPLVMRVYQLKDDAAFKDADFFAIFDQEAKTLAASLVERDEFVLTPGSQKMQEYLVAGGVRFIGVVAAYRDIRNSQWRVVADAPNKSLKNVVKKDRMVVTVERAAVAIAVKD